MSGGEAHERIEAAVTALCDELLAAIADLEALAVRANRRGAIVIEMDRRGPQVLAGPAEN